MPNIRRRFFLTIAVIVLVVRAQGDEQSGSVANVPTRMPVQPQATVPVAGSGTAKRSERLREGTKLVDVIGTFQSAGGDNISFSQEGGKDSFRVLENLWLQRVGQVLEQNQSRGTGKWIVSG